MLEICAAAARAEDGKAKTPAAAARTAKNNHTSM
jgi:hypothetical protein